MFYKALPGIMYSSPETCAVRASVRGTGRLTHPAVAAVCGRRGGRYRKSPGPRFQARDGAKADALRSLSRSGRGFQAEQIFFWGGADAWCVE